MSKRMPTREQRIQQSILSRTELITTLQAVLHRADASVPTDQIQRLQARIDELKRRNAVPDKSLWLGNMLHKQHRQGGVSSCLW